MMLPLLWQALAAGLAALGTAILSNAPRRTLLFASLTGIASQGAALAATRAGLAESAAAFIGGLVVGLMAAAGSRLLRAPTTLFTIPGFIALVPGSLAFRTVEQFLQENLIQGLELGLRTLLVGGAIAAGLAVTTAIRRRPRR